MENLNYLSDEDLVEQAIAQTGDPLTRRALRKIGINPDEMIQDLQESKERFIYKTSGKTPSS